MKLDDLDRELTRLREASERIAANLVELEIDSSRQLLDVSTLDGTSAARWSAASAALTDLWAWRGQLDGLLERAEKLRRGPWGANELRSLLSGPSIELTRSEVPLAERDLLGSPEISVRCTASELLERMSSAFDLAKTVVAQFGAASDALMPRLAAARAALDEAQALAGSLEESERSDLEEASGRLNRLTAALSADPLSVVPAEVDRLVDSLETIRRDLESTAALRGELDARLADGRARLASLRTMIEEGRAVHEELLVKISVPSAPPPPELPDDLSAELHEIARLARSGAWHEARRELDRWTARTAVLLDDAQRALRANRAPIEARNQLRALLEAYQVKAGRVGASEDPELERIFAQAHHALYTAPTDLAQVAQLVRRYQELVSGAGPAREAMR
jgi:hypothetical protein